MAGVLLEGSEIRKRMRPDEISENPQDLLTTSQSLRQSTWPVEVAPVTWFITECLYELAKAKPVYDTVVKARFSAAFLNPAVITGSSLDMQIAAKKAISRFSRNSMITKSLPMELLYALSPRTGISDSLKALGFNPKLSSVLVVWIHSTPSPPEDQRIAFETVALQHGRQLSLDQLRNARNMTVIRDFYEFPPVPDLLPFSSEWNNVLCSYVTSKIATKE